MTTYCLFCPTGKERQVAQHITSVTNAKVLFPVRIMRERNQGTWIDHPRPLTPGYLFCYADEPLNFERAQFPDIYTVLNYGKDGRELRGADLAFALWILQHNGIIAVSKSIIEGDKMRITESPLLEMAGKIVKINLHARRAQIEVVFASRPQRIWLSFDWLAGVETL